MPIKSLIKRVHVL